MEQVASLAKIIGAIWSSGITLDLKPMKITTGNILIIYGIYLAWINKHDLIWQVSVSVIKGFWVWLRAFMPF